ncbi:MAG: lipoate--protein ligase family protein [candidate division NC10 bacterium]|nr:lipoate--protein ligase family protein [candidate division NC10 bacterium]
MRPIWRCIRSGALPGPLNMGLDEALALSCARGEGGPVLRLYAWDPPTVSVGYAQPLAGAVDLEACRRLGVGVVRRMTGGRAVLHQHELTYAVAFPEDFFGPGGVQEDYRRISRGLLLGLRRLGVRADLRRGASGRGPVSSVCFLATSRFELAVGGRKLVGSAQRRLRGAVLQHGSVLVDLEPAVWEAALPALRRPAFRDWTDSIVTLAALLGGRPPPVRVEEALRQGFEEALGHPLPETLPSRAEAEAAAALSQGRYARPEWNKHQQIPASRLDTPQRVC